MITKPTVLVLGAGASSTYDYPTGKSLKNEIIKDVLIEGSRMRNLLHFQRYTERDIVAFRKAFMRSGASSIDSFLEHQPQWIEMGKLAITVALAEKENEDRLAEIGDWYEHLFHALNDSFENFKKNQLSIVTFNYDRSIETYLFNALKYSYNKRDEEVVSVMKSIPIIHLHGQIGNLPWQDSDNFRPYGEMDDQNLLKESSKGIKIIYEPEVEQNENFNIAKKLLINGEQIYFLGFGYHTENIRRLGILDLNKQNKLILGTALHMTGREVSDIMKRCGNKIDLTQPGSQHHTILPFMRENISFF